MAMHATGGRSALLRFGTFALAAAAGGCASRMSAVQSGVSVGSWTLPRPRVEPKGSAPGILRCDFSSWTCDEEKLFGEFVTGTNVASIEVRRNLFSIDVPQ